MEELMLMENPYDYGYSNPKRKKRKSRNPRGIKGLTSARTWREWTQGTDLLDIGAGVAGLYAATTIPGMFVKDTSTLTKKLTKVAASVLVAIATGAAGRSFLSADAGKAAVLGGLAGTAIQSLSMFAGISMGRNTRQLGAPIMHQRFPAPSTEKEFANVRIS